MLQKIDIDKVITIANEAGNAILALFEKQEIETLVNNEKYVVTTADIKSQEIIIKRLTDLNLDIPIFSEENISSKTTEIAENPGFYWLIDPLDGTKEIVQNRGDFTINIALVEKGYPILGVVHIPARNETFFATLRDGAFKRKEGNTVSLQAKKFGFSDPNLVIVCSRNHLDKQTESFMQVLNNPQIKPHGSSLKFTEIAEGNAHIYPRFSPTHAWDTAAAQIITEEAGGRVMDMVSGKRLFYKTPAQLNNGILVTGGVQIPQAIWYRFQQF